MTKQKSTKRALLLSALSLLMCVSMLIGSTFAWFTDSVTSSGNKIKAGNLDVDLYLWTADGQSEITNETAPIFGGANSIAATANNADTLWEPGKTQVVYLSIKNNGSLDLKYKVALDVKDADADQNLYEVMKYAITNDARYGAVDAWDAAKGVSVVPGVNATQANDVALKAGEEHFFALSVHMDEAAGNQYQGGEVDFDIRVLATQLASEFDSFNNQYDKDAVYGDVMVSSDAELKAAIEDPAMKVIAVNGDLTYDWGSESYENSKALNMKGKTFLGANDAASITFAGYGSANPIVDATFRNITIKDSTVGDNEASWEHGYLEFKNLTAVNVTFANSIMMEGDFATFKNCSFNSNKDGEYAVWVANGDATFEGCTFTGPRGVKVHEAYGSEVGTVVIDNNTFAGLTQKPGVVIGDLDATTKVTIKNSTFANCQAGDQSNYIYETDHYTPVLENNKVFNNATVVASAEEFIAATNGGLVVITDDIVYTNADPSKQMIMKAVNDIEFNGNGATITTQGADPSVSNHGYVAFVPAAGQNVTVTDVTITGEGFVEMGDYSIGGGNYVANNLVVKDLVSTLANGDKGKTLACGFAHYGNAELNNCTMTGTTAMINGAMAVDAGFVNGTTTVVNGGEYGTVYCWSHAKVTINGAEVDTLYVSPINGNVTVKAGTHIATLNVDYGTSSANATRLAKLVIEDGATVDAIVFNGNSYTVAEWNAYLATL